MSVKPIKIVFHLDGTGVFYDPYEPPHLDGLLAWCLCAYHTSGQPPRRDEEPAEIPLPLDKWHLGNTWGWKASALLPVGPVFETLQFWRSRFRESRIEMTAGSPNRTNGIYRDWQMPMPLTLTDKLVAYAVGDRSTIHKILRRGVKYVGKKASIGKGRVIGIDVEWVDVDWSMKDSDGRATRWLPDENGSRMVRPRPPYWNNWGKVRCKDLLIP
jgi:hypothetical protein